MPEYVIDGLRIGSFEEFVVEFRNVVLSGYEWNGNLDALNDILRGGFGTPAEGFCLVWKNAAVSRKTLGHQAKEAWLEQSLESCHPTNRQYFLARLADANSGLGPTLFDDLVELIRDHGPGGNEAADNVHLSIIE